MYRSRNPAIIARLDRATQYSRDVQDKPRSRGVLDRPVKPGDDSFDWGGRLWLLLRGAQG
jgi:hypothetical protein